MYPGKEFIIETVNNSENNMFVGDAFLNGEKLEVLRIRHSDLIQGGNLTLIMSDVPVMSNR